MRIALRIAIVLLVLAAYLLLWPVPVEPVAWSAPPDPGKWCSSSRPLGATAPRTS